MKVIGESNCRVVTAEYAFATNLILSASFYYLNDKRDHVAALRDKPELENCELKKSTW